MQLIQTAIPDVVIIEPNVFSDNRGWFMESFNEKRFHQELSALGLPIPRCFVQDNHSCSQKGVLRGFHFQKPPHAQGKLVRVAQGAVYDVAIDVRENSPTFGQSVGVELTAKNKRMLWIPEGFAHGFLTLEDNTHFLYKTTDFYSKEFEVGFQWNDPGLGIQWPCTGEIIQNEKDKAAPFLNQVEPVPSQLGLAVRSINLPIIGDERGSLIALEQDKPIPFAVKRVYYIFDTQSEVSRGFHAHRNLQQLAICVSGSCRMVLDDGKKRQEFWLDSPSKGLLIGNRIWREMHDFSKDCVLMVLASEKYNEQDYIRSYDDFMRII